MHLCSWPTIHLGALQIHTSL